MGSHGGTPYGPEDFSRVYAGDVVIARATAPAWTPLFSRVAAVVTDGGTLAAHASLIAREYGIPAVVATGTVTQRMRDGDKITVDGSRGTVTISPERQRHVHADHRSDMAPEGDEPPSGGSYPTASSPS